jgi:hypothetical protein
VHQWATETPETSHPKRWIEANCIKPDGTRPAAHVIVHHPRKGHWTKVDVLCTAFRAQSSRVIVWQPIGGGGGLAAVPT